MVLIVSTYQNLPRLLKTIRKRNKARKYRRLLLRSRHYAKLCLLGFGLLLICYTQGKYFNKINETICLMRCLGMIEQNA